MPYNNTSINIYTLNSEQRHQVFLELFDTDPSLINALNSELYHRLYSVLIAIDPSLTESLLEFPKGSAMNPITFNKYENYKEAQKKLKRTCSTNSTLPVSKADFILHEWLTSYCNSMAKAKGYTLPPKKNVKPHVRKCNITTNNVNAESILDQTETDETDNLQDSLDNDQEKNKLTKAKAKERVRTTTKKKKSIKWHNGNMNSINIESDHDRSNTDKTDNAQDSFSDNNNITFDKDNIHKAAHNSDTLTTVNDVDDNSSQDE
ncbi:hypothetical protein C2G38_2165569 [Gigaspora rosea]|uniref:Uncharacterized protein n=1 Tax=Gigaspora rosea TaxID=44941 RepID=A0A397VW90_9GLOM|nr:hypothetical protein C2G38_2165569 [Gigaspora rosea]